MGTICCNRSPTSRSRHACCRARTTASTRVHRCRRPTSRWAGAACPTARSSTSSTSASRCASSPGTGATRRRLRRRRSCARRPTCTRSRPTRPSRAHSRACASARSSSCAAACRGEPSRWLALAQLAQPRRQRRGRVRAHAGGGDRAALTQGQRGRPSSVRPGRRPQAPSRRVANKNRRPCSPRGPAASAPPLRGPRPARPESLPCAGRRRHGRRARPAPASPQSSALSPRPTEFGHRLYVHWYCVNARRTQSSTPRLSAVQATLMSGSAMPAGAGRKCTR